METFLNNFKRMLLHVALGAVASVAIYAGSHFTEIAPKVDPQTAAAVGFALSAGGSFLRKQEEATSTDDGE